jgi:hypothetical protein
LLKAGETSLLEGNVASKSLWVAASGKQFAEVKAEFFNSGNKAVIRLITPLRMSYEESYAKAFPFDKMIPGMLDPEMVEIPVRSSTRLKKTESR